MKINEKMGRFKNMNTWLESCKLYIFANFIYYTFGWWLLLLYTIFFVASTSPAKCYSRRRLCSWLFSEETLWVAWEKLFLKLIIIIIIKIIITIIIITIITIKIYLPHPFFTMAFRAIEKKTLKTNKNIKIYQYITVNTKNMATKIVKGLR